MATPNRRPAGSVSTPSNVNQSSPAPRSVPSPVTARQSAGKTPVNHPTTGSTGSKTIGSTPMVQNLSQTGNTSSPNTNMLSFNTPSGLGIEGATPSGINVPTPSLGGVSMMPTMSDLGFTSSGAKRNEDEERRTKMRKILKSIGKSKGRVSEDGIARISRRVGFQNDIDAERLTAEEKERKVGNRPISTAGNVVVIDFNLRDNVPQSVTVEIGKSADLKVSGDLVGKVLLNDLKPRNGVALAAGLDRFALNLERLARIDRLSAVGINCFEALSGIYLSLHRLYLQELAAAQALPDTNGQTTDDKAKISVMCKKSGRPDMHVDGKIGFGVAYWQDGSHLPSRENRDDDGQMDIDNQNNDKTSSDEQEVPQNTYTLRLEAEACRAGLYPPLRFSNAWLPDPLDLQINGSDGLIPWQDPPSTFLSENVSAGAMEVDSEQKLPDLRFIAKLDPPVVMPWQTAMTVLSAVGVPNPQILTAPPSYSALLLNASGHTSKAAFAVGVERSVLSQKDGIETTIQHIYTLSDSKPSYADWAFKIQELPFSHPRQLIELLPVLRQWARFGSLLETTFADSHDPQPKGATQNGGAVEEITAMARMTLDDLLKSPAPQNDVVPVEVSIATLPNPTLEVAFPTIANNAIACVNVQVLLNAEITVTYHEGITLGEATETTPISSERLAKALDVCSDLGVWIEWMRNR